MSDTGCMSDNECHSSIVICHNSYFLMYFRTPWSHTYPSGSYCHLLDNAACGLSLAYVGRSHTTSLLNVCHRQSCICAVNWTEDRPISSKKQKKTNKGMLNSAIKKAEIITQSRLFFQDLVGGPITSDYVHTRIHLKLQTGLKPLCLTMSADLMKLKFVPHPSVVRPCRIYLCT